MGLQDMILQRVLKKIDSTFGKKFKIIDNITDLFQGQQNIIDKLEKRITKLERERNENKHAGKDRRNSDK